MQCIFIGRRKRTHLITSTHRVIAKWRWDSRNNVISAKRAINTVIVKGKQTFFSGLAVWVNVGFFSYPGRMQLQNLHYFLSLLRPSSACVFVPIVLFHLETPPATLSHRTMEDMKEDNWTIDELVKEWCPVRWSLRFGSASIQCNSECFSVPGLV